MLKSNTTASTIETTPRDIERWLTQGEQLLVLDVRQLGE